VCIRFGTLCTHLLEDGLDITLKDLLGHQNIELLPEPYFHVVLLYDSINSLAIHQPKIVSTLFETTWEAATI
jgi:site-specific recombinase XerD